MKTKTFVISATVMVCCFLLSCSKEGNLLTPASGDISKLKAANNGIVITVSPSGNYNDDSYNIQLALNNAVTAGPGSTVQLTAGTFYLKDRIEVDGFDGFFKGAGKDKTIITTYGTVSFDDVVSGDGRALIKFRHGNNNISDMTIKISDPEPSASEDISNALPGAINITGNSVANLGPKDQSAPATFNNVKFVGGTGNFYGYNVFFFIVIGWEGWPPDPYAYSQSGGYKITNCEFQTAYYCLWSNFTNGPCIIGGSESSGNKFENAECALEIQDINNSMVNVSYNHFTKIFYTGINLWQGYIIPSVSLSKYLIYGNDIEMISRDPDWDWTNAIWLVDYGIFTGAYTDTKMDITVSNNRLFLNNISFAGILGECTNNVVVTNNKIWGNAFTGIACGIFDNAPIGQELSSDWIIKGNNLQGLNVHLSPIWLVDPRFQVAPIWLATGTSNCLVVGGSNTTNVLNEGTGNTLTGVNVVQGSPVGPQIQEAMMRKHEMMKLIKGPGMK